MSPRPAIPAQHYRDRAAAMREAAARAVREELRDLYAGMAQEWDDMAMKADRVEERLKH